MVATVILADQPELVALSNLAAVAPSKVAAAFNEPEQFFLHLSLDELARLQAACERLGALALQLSEATDEYTQEARKRLEINAD